jgi:hypothetical protein
MWKRSKKQNPQFTIKLWGFFNEYNDDLGVGYL